MGIDAQVAVVNVIEPLVLINPKIIRKENEIKYYDKDLSDSNLCNSSCDAKLIDSYFEDGDTTTNPSPPFDYGIKKLTDYFGKKSKISNLNKLIISLISI